MDKINWSVCCVSGCGSKRRNRKEVPVYCFPSKCIGKWIFAIQNEHLSNVSNHGDITKKQLFVCRLHFSENQFFSKQNRSLLLKPGTIPHLNLPHVLMTKETNIDVRVDQNSRCTHSAPSACTFSPSVGKLPNTEIENDAPLEEVRLSSLHFENLENVELNTPMLELDPPTTEKCTEAGIVEALTAVEEADNLPEPLYTSTPKHRHRSPKLKYARTRNCVRTIFSKSEIDTFSPGKRKIVNEVDKQRKDNQKLRKMVKRYGHRSKSSADILESGVYKSLSKNLSEVQRQFITMILKNHDKHPTARRYSTEEKIICLSIYKRSQKCYRYLRSILEGLPTESTLKLTLRKVDMDTGITDSTRQRLKEAVLSTKSKKELAVVLMWDEFLLGLGLEYDEKADKIVGFEDWRTARTERFTDHALVFMIRSIETGANLPVNFNFCDSATKSTQLQFCLKEVVKALKDAGFNVVATVCDGARTNESAINELIEDTKRIKGSEYVNRYGTFIVHGVEIIPLFDPPHLFKCIRNNLLHKHLEIDYSENKKTKRKFAEWEHVIIAYEINTYRRRKLRTLHKLTEQHVYPDKIRKMTCKLYNQVFSGALSAEIQALAGGPGWDIGAKELLQMPIEGRVTAEVFAYFNILCDFFNGKILHDKNSIYRTLYNDTSFHADFFTDAKSKLIKMRYVDRETKKPIKSQPPCLRNLRKTIDGIELIWKKLKEQGFTCLKTKHLNQDPLENFFGLIRDHGAQNNKPTCYQFIGHFKALVINNLTHSYIRGSNCEDDRGTSLLTWKSYLLFVEEAEKEAESEDSRITPHNPVNCNPKITASATPIPEKYGTETSILFKELRTKQPSLESCPECMKLVSCQCGPSSTRTMSPLNEIHSDLVSLLKRILNSIFEKHAVIKLATQYLIKEIRLEIVTYRVHRQSLVESFLHCSIKKYIASVTAYLNLLLKGKRKSDHQTVNDGSNENCNSKQAKNTFVERAVQKRQASLHKKKGTFNKTHKDKSNTKI